MPGDAISPETGAALGLLQGLTEFLPVSSSGHVAGGALLFGIPDMPLAMIVVLHAGTLIATLMVVGRDAGELALGTLRGLRAPRALLQSETGRIVVAVSLASLPTAVIGLALESRVEKWSHSPTIIGALLLVTAAMLWSTRWTTGSGRIPSVGVALLIGVAQGLAVLPGISRSGATIATAMLLGMRAPDAFRFSFLLSLPAVTGALLLQLRDVEALQSLGASAWIGGGVAMISGYAALLILRRVVAGGRLWAFALYLLPLGALLMMWGLTAR